MQVSLFDVMPKRKKSDNPSTEELLTGEDLEEDLCLEVENSSTSDSSMESEAPLTNVHDKQCESLPHGLNNICNCRTNIFSFETCFDLYGDERRKYFGSFS